jgi:Chaperone of endosialidase
MKTAIPLFVIVVQIVCVASLENAHAVSPPPDGGYPGGNTAEGQNALLSLSSGGYNTAVGYLSLLSNTTGSFNTALGAGALLVNTADRNTATGAGALLSNTTGVENTANGAFGLFANTTGNRNNAVGSGALQHHSTGDFNNAVGAVALSHDQNGLSNNAFGDEALFSNISGDGNTAIGDSALSASTGDNNTALGDLAGNFATTGSGNVYIGAGMSGVGGEDNHTYIRNINTTSVSGGGTDTVTVDLATGLLGHLSSSRRHKEQIEPMANSSEVLYRLKPVTYRYKKEIDRSQALDYGLIAEEVAEIDPNLTACNNEGQIETVRYNAINAMLLNEFLKEHGKVEKLQTIVARQQKQIDALTTGLQKVSAQLQIKKTRRQVVLNNQ